MRLKAYKNGRKFSEKSLFLYAIFHCLEDYKVLGKDSSPSEINIFVKENYFLLVELCLKCKAIGLQKCSKIF